MPLYRALVYPKGGLTEKLVDFLNDRCTLSLHCEAKANCLEYKNILDGEQEFKFKKTHHNIKIIDNLLCK